MKSKYKMMMIILIKYIFFKVSLFRNSPAACRVHDHAGYKSWTVTILDIFYCPSYCPTYTAFLD